MKLSFKESKPSLLVLSTFLLEEAHAELIRILRSSQGREQYVPHESRFKALPSSAGRLFASRGFLDFVRSISSHKASTVALTTYQFSHRDFTLLHDDLHDHARLIFFYTLTSSPWKPAWGGSRIFSYGDEREPLIFEPTDNTLALIAVPKGMRDFVKYVNHFAGDDMITKIEGIFS